MIFVLWHDGHLVCRCPCCLRFLDWLDLFMDITKSTWHQPVGWWLMSGVSFLYLMCQAQLLAKDAMEYFKTLWFRYKVNIGPSVYIPICILVKNLARWLVKDCNLMLSAQYEIVSQEQSIWPPETQKSLLELVIWRKESKIQDKMICF